MVVSVLLGFWRAARRQRAVVQLLSPYVERWRASAVEPRWSDPAVIGFLVTLITRLAYQHGDDTNTDALGALQAGAWSALTGESPDLIGERTVELSTGEDARFLRGCRNAIAFADALTAIRGGGRDPLGTVINDDPSLPDASTPRVAEDLQALWNRLIQDVG